jgi:tripeptidyl-peptidase-1
MKRDLALGLLLLLAGLALALSAPRRSKVLYTARPPPGNWRLASAAVDPHEQLDVTFGLYRQRVAEMESIFFQVSNPEHEEWGNHLSSKDMAALVAPSKASVRKVIGWLSSSGITKIVVGPHSDYIRATATIEQLETLLAVTFRRFQLHDGTGGALSRVVEEVRLPHDMADIVEVVGGITGFPINSIRASGSGKQQKVNSPQTVVTPALLYSVYNVTEFPATPAGQYNIQSFFQAQGQYVDASDLTLFCNAYLANSGIANLSAKCQITKYIGPNVPSVPGVESSLDSQYILSTSHGTETWSYSFSNSDFCGDLIRWAADVFEYSAKGQFPHVISMSYGAQSIPNYCLGPDVQRLSQDVQKMGTMGISVIIASGDDGSGESNRQSGYNYGLLSGSFPAAIPWATSVGSTTFISGNSGEQESTTVFGSGGGFSYDYSTPVYQVDAVRHYFAVQSQLPPRLSYNRTGRGTPDVSALGEGFQVYDGGVVNSVDGTSCACPTVAGFITLLNNVRLRTGKTLGFLNMLFYQHPEMFNDITVGSNDVKGDGYGWYDAKGWDPSSGLGTPNVGRMIEVVKSLSDRQAAKQTLKK